jgi:hypothetical protein
MMMEKSVEWLARETEVFGENLPQCRFVHHKPPHAAHTRTRAAAVGSQRLTACATARPRRIKLIAFPNIAYSYVYIPKQIFVDNNLSYKAKCIIIVRFDIFKQTFSIKSACFYIYSTTLE